MIELETMDVRERILEMATGLFVAQGYDGISMREIADACHLSKAGLYYHFKDKQALFLAVLDDHLVELERLLSSIEAQPGTARTKIRAFVQAVFTQLPADHRAIIRLASQDMGKIDPVFHADFNQRYQEKFLNRLAGLLETGIVSGQVCEMDAHLGVWALLGLMYPFMNQDFSETGGEAESVAAFIEKVFFDGVEPCN